MQINRKMSFQSRTVGNVLHVGLPPQQLHEILRQKVLFATESARGSAVVEQELASDLSIQKPFTAHSAATRESRVTSHYLRKGQRRD